MPENSLPPESAGNGLADRPAKSRQTLSGRAALVTVLLCMVFGANAVAVKVSFFGLGVFTSAAIRFGIAGGTIWLWACLAGKPLALSAHQRKQLAPLGALFFIQLSLFYLGQSRTTATHGTLITNALPFVVMVLAHIFLADDRISLRKLVGLLFGFTGVVFLFFDTVQLQEASWEGDALVLGAVLVWGSNAVYSKRIIASFHPAQFTAVPMLIATPLFAICAALFDAKMFISFNDEVIWALLYQTFISGSFGMVAWNTMIKRYGATSLHSFVFLMPLSGVSLGVLLLGEPLTGNLLGSIALVTTGLCIVNWRR